MNSIEKLHAFRTELMQTEPPDQETAQLMQVAQNIMPFVLPMLPTDPAELDRHLLGLAKWAVSMRSDDDPEEAAVMIRQRGDTTAEPAAPAAPPAEQAA